MHAKKRRCPIDIALAASYTLTEPSLLLKTVKIGLLARLLSVFRVDNVILFIDRGEAWREAAIAKRILEYMVTAPYLRKYVYPPNVPELRYVGVLPPLQLPIHGVGGPREGEVREALVVRLVRGGVLVEAGLGTLLHVRTHKRYRRGERILVKIVSIEPLRVELAEDSDVYRGFKVHVENSLLSTVNRYRGKRYMLATSRKGKVMSLDNIRARKESLCSTGLLVLFGAPDRGLFEIAELEGIDLLEISDEVINTVPNQGTRTVRVEEALAATLSLLNIVLD